MVINLCSYWFYRCRKICNTWYKTLRSVVTLSTQDNTKLLLKEKNNNWNKYQSDAKTYAQNRYLNHLVGPGFQGVNTLFVLSFENDDDKRSHSNYYLSKVEVKDYNVMNDGKK